MILDTWTDGRAATATKLISTSVSARFGGRTRWSWRELGRSPQDAARLLDWARQLEARQVVLDDRAAREAFGLLFLVVSAELARSHEGAEGARLWERVKAGFPRAADALFVQPASPNARVKEAIEGAVERYVARHALHLDQGKHRWWRTVGLHAGWSGHDFMETVPGWLAGQPDTALVEALTNSCDPFTYSATFVRVASAMRAVHRRKDKPSAELDAIARSPWIDLPVRELMVVLELAKLAPPRTGAVEPEPEALDVIPFVLRRTPEGPNDAQLVVAPAGWADFDTPGPLDLVVASQLVRRVNLPADGWGAIAPLALPVELPAGSEGLGVALRARSGATLWQGFVSVDEFDAPAAAKPKVTTAKASSPLRFQLGDGPVRLVGVTPKPLELTTSRVAEAHSGALLRAGWRWTRHDPERGAEGTVVLGQTAITITRPRQPPGGLASALGQPLTLLRRGFARSTLIDFFRPSEVPSTTLVGSVTATDRITSLTQAAGRAVLGFDGPLEPSADHAVSALLRDGRVRASLAVTEPAPGRLEVATEGAPALVALTFRGARQDAAFAPSWWQALALANVGEAAALLALAEAPIETQAADAALTAFCGRDLAAVVRAWTQAVSPPWRAAAQRRFWLDGVPNGFDVRSAIDATELGELIARVEPWHPLWAVRHAATSASGRTFAVDYLRTRFHLRHAEDAMRLWEDLAAELQFNLALVRNTLTPLVRQVAKGEAVAGSDRPLLVSAMAMKSFVTIATVAMWATLCPEFSPV